MRKVCIGVYINYSSKIFSFLADATIFSKEKKNIYSQTCSCGHLY